MRVLCEVANGLANRGLETRFLVPERRRTAPIVPLHRAVTVLPVATPSGLPGEILGLARAAAPADLIIANYYPTAYAAALAQRFSRDKAAAVYFVQGLESVSHGLLAPSPRPARWIRWALASASYRLGMPRVCTTRWLADQTGGQGARVAPLGVDLDRFHPRVRMSGTGQPLTVGVIGREAPAKGLADLLSAWRQVDQPTQLLILSEERLKIPANLQAELVPGGPPDVVADFYRRCDIFVQPSWVEGFSLPVLEAMASGCAVLTTDCGGVREYVRPGANAQVVPARDPSRLAGALNRLLRDTSLRRDLAREAVATALKYPRQPRLDSLLDALLSATDRQVSQPGPQTAAEELL